MEKEQNSSSAVYTLTSETDIYTFYKVKNSAGKKNRAGQGKGNQENKQGGGVCNFVGW